MGIADNAGKGAVVDSWPNCPIADCPNKINLRLNSGRCWPHTVGMPVDWYKGLKMQDREAIIALKEAQWRGLNGSR